MEIKSKPTEAQSSGIYVIKDKDGKIIQTGIVVCPKGAANGDKL